MRHLDRWRIRELPNLALWYLRQRIHKWRQARQITAVPLDRLLLGGENIIPAAKYARLIDDPRRPSTPLSESPHVKLLEQYQAIGDRLFEPGVLEQSDYYHNALQNIDILGHYFGVKSEAQICEVARRFVNHFRGVEQSHLPLRFGQSHPDAPIRVRPIKRSDCYQITDGHHRLAIAYVKGEREARVLVDREPVFTPLQSLLLDVLWLNGRLELYQPIDAPELKSEWILVRRCTDRLSKMQSFLDEHDLLPPALNTYLDIGSSYGWFVAEMGKLGFEAYGVERDPIAASVGPLVYCMGSEQVFRSDVVRYLRRCDTTFDVTSCLSLLQHFVLGRGSVSAEELIRMVDAVTSKILFLDTGQKHEAWYKDSLPDWNVDFIHAWLEKHTSFTQIHRLGPDEDAVPPFEDNYGRMLFACVK